jgi:small subunit ribosomal protein S6
MRERRRDYELMFIISPLRSSEEEINTTISRVHQAITTVGGEIADTDQTPPWGRRKFAYPIREYAEGEPSRRAFNEGYYVLCHFKLPAARVPDVERSLKLNDAVLRYLFTLVDGRSQAAPPVAAVARGADAAAGAGAAAEAEEDEMDEFEDDSEDENTAIEDEET